MKSTSEEIDGTVITIHWDELQYQHLDTIERTVSYECRGYDANGREYTGIATFTCGDLDEITEVEPIK